MQRPEVGGQRGVKLETLAGDRVHERQVVGVQGKARGHERLQFPIAVHRISEHRVAQRGEVDAHLMRSAGAQFRFDERRPAQRFKRPQVGEGRLPAAGR